MEEKLKAFYELYDRRRSVREFSDRPVEEEKIRRLLSTVSGAQSAANRQPWHFIIIGKNDESRALLNEVFTKEGFKAAPLVIVACADPRSAWVRKSDGVNYAWVDTTIAITEMIGAATAEGIGCCWVAAIDPVSVKKILAIPAHIEVVSLIALGYPIRELAREEKARKPLEEIVHYGRW